MRKALDNYLDKVSGIRQQSAQEREEASKQADLKKVIEQAAKEIADSLAIQHARSRVQSQKTRPVEVQNLPKIATTEDIQAVVSVLEELGESLKPKEVDHSEVVSALQDVSTKLEALPKAFPESPEPVEDVSVKNLGQVEEYLKPLIEAVNSINVSPVFDPRITVKPADVRITEKEVDLSPVANSIEKLAKELGSLKPQETSFDDLKEAIGQTTKAINSLQFPVANYILPFKDPTTGKATQIILTSGGALPTSSVVTNYATKIDTTTTSGVTYIGKAAIGSSAANAVWQIKKLDTNTLALDKTWADSGAFTQIWDNRATTVSYS